MASRFKETNNSSNEGDILISKEICLVYSLMALERTSIKNSSAHLNSVPLSSWNWDHIQNELLSWKCVRHFVSFFYSQSLHPTCLLLFFFHTFSTGIMINLCCDTQRETGGGGREMWNEKKRHTQRGRERKSKLITSLLSGFFSQS